MTDDRQRDVLRVYEGTLACEGEARAAYLDEACAADPDLRREVESLLAQQSAAEAFLERPAVERAPADAAPIAPVALPREPLSRGTRLGPYEVLGLIGAGGMGEVYTARDIRLDRTVAIKVLPAELSADPERRVRFEREAKTIAGLSHPHICTLYDVGEHPSTGSGKATLYLVMEHLQGETLAGRLLKGRLPLDQSLTVATEIADALAAAHRQGIVHRDLKPGNVMLTKAGAKLLDFGLAKLKGHGAGPAAARLESAATRSGSLTAEGTIVGTLQYMAPEQVEGKPVDARTDLWALGAILYEMVTGKRAFEGTSAASLIGSIMDAEPPALSAEQPLTPPALDRLVRQCLAKSPDDRPDTAHDVGNDLRWLREGSGLAAPLHVPARRSRRWVFAFLGGAVVVAIGVLVALRPGRHAAPPPPLTPAAAVHDRTAIAVLPPQNLSADGQHAYFAGGLHDELLTQLAKVASLKVISRTSVMGYRGTTKPLKQIADELGVGSIVEGSVQVVNGRLRVSVELIDAATDQTLWAERYDRTLDDAFAVQSDIAQQIVAAVGVALTTDEQGRLASVPTANAEAYRLYLQGRAYHLRPGYRRTDLERAAQLYQQALGLDPDFALAHADLSRVHGRMYWFRYDPSPSRAARQREEAETALRLVGDLPQAHLAMGEARYRGRRDWRGALDEYTIARKGLPNDAELWEEIGYAHRRLGEWDAVFVALEKATELNPREADLYWDLGGFTNQLVRRYADAVRSYERALSLAPDLRIAAIFRGWTYVRWQGRLDVLQETLARAPGDAEIAPQGTAEAHRALLLLWARNADGLLQGPGRPRDAVFVGQWHFLPVALYTAWGSELRGDGAAARAAFDAARVRLDAAVQELPDDWRAHAARGLAMAGLGRRGEALGEARWLQESEVYRADAYEGPLLAEDRARILAQAGYADEALDEIERLLAGPSWLSVHTLRLDPRWDPIRNRPRFKALLAKWSASEAR